MFLANLIVMARIVARLVAVVMPKSLCDHFSFFLWILPMFHHTSEQSGWEPSGKTGNRYKILLQGKLRHQKTGAQRSPQRDRTSCLFIKVLMKGMMTLIWLYSTISSERLSACYTRSDGCATPIDVQVEVMSVEWALRVHPQLRIFVQSIADSEVQNDRSKCGRCIWCCFKG